MTTLKLERRKMYRLLMGAARRDGRCAPGFAGAGLDRMRLAISGFLAGQGLFLRADFSCENDFWGLDPRRPMMPTVAGPNRSVDLGKGGLKHGEPPRERMARRVAYSLATSRRTLGRPANFTDNAGKVGLVGGPQGVDSRAPCAFGRSLEINIARRNVTWVSGDGTLPPGRPVKETQGKNGRCAQRTPEGGKRRALGLEVHHRRRMAIRRIRIRFQGHR